jgi:YHS domain-containing protein
MKIHSKYGLLLLIVFALWSSLVLAQADDLRKNNFNVDKKVAIEGYDPVSYFDNKPLEGDRKFQHTYRGITYLFASAANLDRFRAAPEKYEPSYGGWCAYAMGEKGEKVEVDPETFKVLDGKLYLFYNSWGNNTLTKWNKNEKALKSQGDQNWKKFIP